MKPVGIENPLLKSVTPEATEAKDKAPGVFQELLTMANTDQQNADQAIRSFMTGETDNIQHVVSQMVKSEMSFHLFMEVRNQIMESYNELMRMQV